MSDKILAALKTLDPKKDEHWTVDGQPRLDVVKAAANDQAVTREDIIAAAPTFNRQAAAAGLAPAATPAGTTAPAEKTAGTAPPAPPAPRTQAPKPPLPTVGDETAIKQAAEELADAQEQLAQIEQWLVTGKSERDKAQKRTDAAQAKLDRLQPPTTTRNAIAGYLERQKQILAARGAALAKAAAFRAEHGFSISDLLPQRAKVDAIRARRLGHGNARPQIQTPGATESK